MKKIKIISILMSATIVLNMATMALVSETYKNQYQIGEGATYTELYATNSSGNQVINYIEYEPNSQVSPVIVYGDKLYGRSDINSATTYLEGLGYNVIGGINGDFYALATGIPIGIVMREGRLVSSDAWQYAIGFKADGSAIIEQPKMSINVYKDGQATLVSYYNKTRTSAGIYLLDTGFSAETRISSSGTNIILERLDDNEITPTSDVSVKVVDIVKTSSSTSMSDNQLVLTIDDAISDKVPDYVIGDVLTISTRVNNAEWNDVQYAVGGSSIIQNGAIVSGLSTSTDPRSAVGVKADGTVVVYEVDGRQSPDATGLSIYSVAEELLNLGCISALNLDGGGSSSFSVQLPGESSSSVVNSPSDGSLRKNANYIMFVNNSSSNGVLDMVHLYPENNLMLVNSSINIDVKGTDSSYYPVTVNKSYSLTADGKSISNNVFTATDDGDVEIKSTYNGNSDTKTIKVLSNISSVVVKNEDDNSTVETVIVDPGKSINLTVNAIYNGHDVMSTDESFTWSVTSTSGTITDDGIFTASSVKDEGIITISYLGNIVKEIPITVGLKIEQPADLIADFEAINPFSSTNAILSLDELSVANGMKSLKVVYDFSSEISLDIDTELDENSFINFRILGDGLNNSLYANFENSSGTTTQVEALSSLSNSEFVNVSVEAPTGAVKFMGFTVKNTENSTGSIYFDHITMSLVANDNVAPSISVYSQPETASGSYTMTGKIADNLNYYLEDENINIRLNGNDISYVYAQNTGYFSISSTNLLDGLNKITIDLVDNLGNSTLETFEFTNGSSSNKFQDTNYSWAKDYISFNDQNGIVTGEIVDGYYYFNPDRNLSRAEFAIIMARFLGLNTSGLTAESEFDDADEIPTWALDSIIAVSNVGIMNGSSEGGKLNFNATNSISRAEVITVLGRIIESGLVSKTPTFSDADLIPNWSEPYFKKLYTYGIINGYEDNSINPLGNITRAEVCKLIYSVM